MRILSLDPSVNNVGWAVFDSTEHSPKGKKAWKWGTYKLEGDNYIHRCTDLAQKLVAQKEIGEFDILVTEWPTFFDSVKGHIAAHNNYTIDLAGMCGYIAGIFDLDHRSWYKCTATQWKGTVKKEITQRKFFRIFGKLPEHISEHAIDAVMLLRWWLQNYGEQICEANGEVWTPNQLLIN